MDILPHQNVFSHILVPDPNLLVSEQASIFYPTIICLYLEASTADRRLALQAADSVERKARHVLKAKVADD